MGGDLIPGPLDALRGWLESGSHVQSCGALSAEAGSALPLDGGVKCQSGGEGQGPNGDMGSWISGKSSQGVLTQTRPGGSPLPGFKPPCSEGRQHSPNF
jgi:hypothetical protein